MTSKRSRAFCLTVNNYSEVNLNTIHELIGNARYQIFGQEVGDSGTPHLQGYINFPSPISIKSCIKILNTYGIQAHVTIANGEPSANYAYCSKDGQFLEVGERPLDRGRAGGMAERERWDLARAAAKAGTFDEIPSDIYMRTTSACHRIHQIALETAIKLPNDVLDNHWYYGPSGIGKSKKAREDFPGAYLKMKNKWWNGYQFEENVIVDDIDPDHAKWIGAFLKEWSDHYQFQAETKGGTFVIRPKRIIVTSQYSIDQVFSDRETCAALHRRFKTTVFRQPLMRDHNQPIPQHISGDNE